MARSSNQAASGRPQESNPQQEQRGCLLAGFKIHSPEVMRGSLTERAYETPVSPSNPLLHLDQFAGGDWPGLLLTGRKEDENPTPDLAPDCRELRNRRSGAGSVDSRPRS